MKNLLVAFSLLLMTSCQTKKPKEIIKITTKEQILVMSSNVKLKFKPIGQLRRFPKPNFRTTGVPKSLEEYLSNKTKGLS